MNREQALEIVNRYITNPNMVKHMLAAEAVMRALATTIWGRRGALGTGGFTA